MGLITGLLTLPLAPLRGTVAIAELLMAEAEKELNDPARIRAEFERVESLRAQGVLGDEEADAWEDQLIERLVGGSGASTHGGRP
jgi:hypothetical protein